MTLLRILLLLAAALTAGMHASASSPMVCDIDMAREICDNTPLDNVEGVWLYPDDHVTVLIIRDNDTGTQASQRYLIIAVESDDCSIKPGETIGWLETSADPRKLKMQLFTKRSNNILASPAECLATLSSDGESISVRGKKLKLKLNPMSLLPRFWRIARLNVDNPLDKLDPGMIKIYPSYDGNGSSRRKPRYL